MSEKTEPASEKKLEDAREKGQVAHSRDLAFSFAFAFALVAMVVTGPSMVDHLRKIISLALLMPPNQADDALHELQGRLMSMVTEAMWVVLPVVGAAMVGSLVGGFAQGGINVSFEPLAPKLDKLDPVAGTRRIFSFKSLVEVLKTIIKAVLIGWVLYVLIRSFMPMLVQTTYGSVEAIGVSAWSAVLRLLGVCAAAAVVLGVVDFVVQRMIFLKDQKMSKDDTKREYKEMEGDPQLKGERKALAKKIAFSPQKPVVAGANVVVVNPTHYAVALRYKPEEFGLPLVVAKGMDLRAAEIRSMARELGIPIIGNPELARALYKQPLNQAVPEELLEAVAIVLRWAEQLSTGDRA